MFVLGGALILAALFSVLRPPPPAVVPPPPTPLAAAPAAAPLAPVAPVSAPPPASEARIELKVEKGRLVQGPPVTQVPQGTVVTFSILTDHADELHLHGYDLTLKLKKGEQGHMAFVADRSGRFTYELHHHHAELGALEVLPAP